MKDGDYGLFVALSKFRKNALDFLSQNPIIRGIDGDEFVELFMKHYEKLDTKIRNAIPLKMVYVAAPQSVDPD
jgi:restriction system protein